MGGLADAQHAPGNGGDQSPAGSVPKGSQTSTREYAATAGGTPDPESPSAGHSVLDYRG